MNDGQAFTANGFAPLAYYSGGSKKRAASASGAEFGSMSITTRYRSASRSHRLAGGIRRRLSKGRHGSFICFRAPSAKLHVRAITALSRGAPPGTDAESAGLEPPWWAWLALTPRHEDDIDVGRAHAPPVGTAGWPGWSVRPSATTASTPTPITQ